MAPDATGVWVKLTSMRLPEGMALICFSHLRWNFVYQRPQHLMSRISRKMRVFFIEEPYFDDKNYFDVANPDENLWIVVPHLRKDITPDDAIRLQKEFLSQLIEKMGDSHYVTWYYTPMALKISDHLKPAMVVYDCMDELTAFKFAPQELRDLEKSLMRKADVVFTGGHSLFNAKKHQHQNIYPFPSSIDYDHFSKARKSVEDPADQVDIAHPRFGFYGVIDERMDLKLLEGIALKKKDWNIILIGPVVKIEESELPRVPNIHYLGMKNYQELPQYLAGWDVAIMPFAINESTKFISPTKTPEFLAGGKPVISTPINDVIKQYCEVVHFATTIDDFIAVAEKDVTKDERWLKRVDGMLAENSWDNTWQRMENILIQTLNGKESKYNTEKRQEYV
jgi:glycosyltransferase involved in cell wall biosynthesis